MLICGVGSIVNAPAASQFLGNIFGIEIITQSVGLYMMICGFASFVGAPAAG